MAKTAGRDFVVKKNATTIAAVTSKSITVDNQPIDVTSDDDSGVQTFLSDVFATKSMQIQVEGYTSDDVFSDIAFATSDSGAHLSDLTVERANGDVVSGTFILTNYVETGASAEGTTFSASLVRSAVHTWTPSA